ncbi:GNAT family N-acetyltransferase [Catelliglobosispora koreensis]|uniref:GNAT family N-acetyltransferase n=1 Tax=Catelliglobosispora koreensis TaxID=129052 RepID=UPI0006874ECB
MWSRKATSLPSLNNLRVRVASEPDYAAIGELTVAAYRGDGQTSADHPYEPVLRDVVSRADAGTILVCEDGGLVVGAVLFVLPGSEYAELSRAGEAEFRMLAVAPSAQRRGVGEALVRGCLTRAADLGCEAVVICVRDFAVDAQRLYKRLGFVREPSLDWSPMDGVSLLGLRCQL